MNLPICGPLTFECVQADAITESCSDIFTIDESTGDLIVYTTDREDVGFYRL